METLLGALMVLGSGSGAVLHRKRGQSSKVALQGLLRFEEGGLIGFRALDGICGFWVFKQLNGSIQLCRICCMAFMEFKKLTTLLFSQVYFDPDDGKLQSYSKLHIKDPGSGE